MIVKEIYPQVEKRKIKRQTIIEWARWPFVFVGLLCMALNLATGGLAWSIVVAWALWMVWSMCISTDMVGYGLISQSAKLIENTCILLTLIAILLSPELTWALEAVPLVCFFGLCAVAAMYFPDFNMNRQNMMPILIMIINCIVGAISGLLLFDGEKWALAIMGILSFTLLAVFASKLGLDFIKECKKGFNLK